jgi:hypothetical protein
MISGSRQDNFVEFSPGNAWESYPPKKTLYPSDDFIEVSAFGVSGEAQPGWVRSEVEHVDAMDELGGGKNIKKKNKTRKDKRKKYKTKKKKRKN